MEIAHFLEYQDPNWWTEPNSFAILLSAFDRKVLKDFDEVLNELLNYAQKDSVTTNKTNSVVLGLVKGKLMGHVCNKLDVFNRIKCRNKFQQ